MAASMMGTELGNHCKEDIRTEFNTREGTYHLASVSEYSKETKFPASSSSPGSGGAPVKLSYVRVTNSDGALYDELICLNFCKELSVCKYSALRKADEFSRPIERKLFERIHPTCHEFNKIAATSNRVVLIVGFSNGQIQLIEKDNKRMFNSDQLIDKTRVTCMHWVPNCETQFMVSHSSGQLFVFDIDLPNVSSAPVYQMVKQGLGFSIHSCKTKNARNPLYCWSISGGTCINEFSFSPCSRYLAMVSQDGFLRVFNFDCQELMGVMKSYFGGLRCICWSPDCKYIVTGGEDDLVTVWSLAEKRVICRNVGHRSWVSVVAFDPYMTSVCKDGVCDYNLQGKSTSLKKKETRNAVAQTTEDKNMISYRIGSVGDDTMMCLWEITEDVLTQRLNHSPAAHSPISNGVPSKHLSSAENNVKTKSQPSHEPSVVPSLMTSSSESSGLAQKFASLSMSEQHKQPKRGYSTLSSRASDSKLTFGRLSSVRPAAEDVLKLLGTPACPRLTEVPLLDPLVCKKIARDRLTTLVFQRDCIITACHEGVLCLWLRPGSIV